MLQKKWEYSNYSFWRLFDDKKVDLLNRGNTYYFMKRIFPRAIYYYNAYLFNTFQKNIPPSNVYFSKITLSDTRYYTTKLPFKKNIFPTFAVYISLTFLS